MQGLSQVEYSSPSEEGFHPRLQSAGVLKYLILQVMVPPHFEGARGRGQCRKVSKTFVGGDLANLNLLLLPWDGAATSSTRGTLITQRKALMYAEILIPVYGPYTMPEHAVPNVSLIES